MKIQMRGYWMLTLLLALGCGGGAASQVQQNQHPLKEEKAIDADTVLHIEYYENGKIKQSSMYKKKVRHGPFKEYYPVGSIKCEKEYVNGDLHGPETCYDGQGSIISSVKYSEGIPDACLYKENGNNCYYFNPLSDTSVCFDMPGYCFDDLFDAGIVFNSKKSITARKDIALAPKIVAASSVYHAKMNAQLEDQLQELLNKSKELRGRLPEGWQDDSIHYIGETTYYLPEDAVMAAKKELAKAPAKSIKVSRYAIAHGASLIVAMGGLRIKDSYYAKDPVNHSYQIRSYKIYLEKKNKIIFELDETHLIQNARVIKNKDDHYLIVLLGGYETWGLASYKITETEIKGIVTISTWILPVEF